MTHNIEALFLAVSSVQLARHNKELCMMLKPGGTNGEGDEALEFYANHTAQIEVITHNLCHELKPSLVEFHKN